jgi:competence protein ComEC
VIKSFDVKKIIMPKVENTTTTFDELLDLIKEKGLKITSPVVGQEYKLDKATFKILAPICAYKNINNNSVVIRLSHGENDFLFTGDIEKKAEKDILDNTKNLDAEVLKVAHHGSNSSSTSKFLKTVKPKYAVICVGEDNQYKRPHPKTIKRIESVGALIYRTDKNGSIVFKSNGSEITITTTNKSDEK